MSGTPSSAFFPRHAGGIRAKLSSRHANPVGARKASGIGVCGAGVVITTEVLTICIMQAELVMIMATNEVCVRVCAGDGRTGHNLTDTG